MALIPFKMELVEACEQEVRSGDPGLSAWPLKLRATPQSWPVPAGELQHRNCDPELGQVGLAPNLPRKTGKGSLLGQAESNRANRHLCALA